MLAVLACFSMYEEHLPLPNVSMSAPAHHPQTPPPNLTCQPTLSYLPFGQQYVHPTLFGLLTLPPSSHSDPLSDQPPATDSELGVYWACG